MFNYLFLLCDVDFRCTACVTELACVIELARVQTFRPRIVFGERTLRTTRVSYSTSLTCTLLEYKVNLGAKGYIFSNTGIRGCSFQDRPINREVLLLFL